MMIKYNPTQNVLVLGAYGLIGYAISHSLQSAGHEVSGLGRKSQTALRVLPNIRWLIHDIAKLQTIENWSEVLGDFTHVVNCSGALQDGATDDLEAIHHTAIAALADACRARNIKVIQISALGATLDAKLPFLATKARGDQVIKASGVAYNIFRPGLVLADSAYGGTAMLRMLAAVPLIQPLAMPKAQIQTTSVHDVANAVCAAVDGILPDGLEANLVEPAPHDLRVLVLSIRNWLGFAQPRLQITFPKVLIKLTGKIADQLGRLGWRSPLRSTSINVLSAGVTGPADDLTQFGLPPAKTLQQSLQSTPAHAEDRLFARILLLMPLIIASLSVFWFLSGVIGLLRINVAAQTLQTVGWPYGMAAASVAFWAVVDIGIAAGLMVRRYTPWACWAAVLVSVFYLGASTIFVPSLWADPLGPLVKVIPSILLALVARIALESR